MGIKKNFIYNSLYQILAVILPLVTSPYLSRTLGSEGLGIYSYTYSIAYYFVLCSMLGVNNYGSRAVAVARSDQAKLRNVFWSIWFLQLSLTLICLLVYFVYSFFCSMNVVYALIWIPYVLSAGIDINWLFFGLEQFKLTVIRNFVVKVSTFILTFIFVRGDYALRNYLILMSLSFLASVIALWPYVLKHIKPVRVELSDIVSHIKPDIVLFVPVIAVSFYTVLDKVMLGAIAGMNDAGIFDNSLKVAQMPFSFITALGTVMLPHASNQISLGNRSSVTATASSSMWVALLLSSAFSFGLAAITPEFVPVFFGGGFEACKIVLPVLVIEMPFMAWANVIRTQWLIPNNRDRVYVSSVIVGAVVNLLLNVLLLSRLGALGAAISTLFAEISVCVVQTVAVRRELPMLEWIKDSTPGFIIGMLMFLFVRAIQPLLGAGVLAVVLEIISGIIFFAISAYIYFSNSSVPHGRTLLIQPLSNVVNNRTRREK